MYVPRAAVVDFRAQRRPFYVVNIGFIMITSMN